tara:strand:+ start:493 stop:1851 length:1359 start_codon:yes stop_codon:yes gene_type:complete
MATRLELELEKKMQAVAEQIKKTKEKIAYYESIGHEHQAEALRTSEDGLQVQQDVAKEQELQKKNLKQIATQYSEVGDRAKAIGDKIEGFFKSFPGGDLVAKAFGIDGLGDKIQDQVIGKIQESFGPINQMGGAFKFAFGPLSVGLALITGIIVAVRRVRRAARELAGELGTSAKFAKEQLVSLKAQELSLKAQNFDSTNLQTTFKDIVTTFGSLENATAANAANLEKLSQSTGTSASDIVKFNKVMMDLTGASFDVATNMAETAISMAESANVSTNKVMSDISSSAADFARFSMQGAQGLAEAAVEAAKVGANLSGILQAADSLLEFESSITAQFKAQVLTGKQINTERARQLALDGDIAGLTSEIQSIVGQVGDIQTLNVIQRKSVADAIGISVADLLRISRGEQAQQQETVQDKLSITNKLLAAGNEEATKILVATENNQNVNINATTF